MYSRCLPPSAKNAEGWGTCTLILYHPKPCQLPVFFSPVPQLDLLLPSGDLACSVVPAFTIHFPAQAELGRGTLQSQTIGRASRLQAGIPGRGAGAARIPAIVHPIAGGVQMEYRKMVMSARPLCSRRASCPFPTRARRVLARGQECPRHPRARSFQTFGRLYGTQLRFVLFPALKRWAIIAMPLRD
jgi:hypothetical protein